MAETAIRTDELTGGRPFALVKNGYDPDEVKRFAEEAKSQLIRLDRENRQLRQQIDAAKPTTIDERTVATFLGEETSRLLTVARQTADDLVARAEAHASEITEAAEREADRRRTISEQERQEALDAALSEANTTLDSARKERDAILNDLELRRDDAMSAITFAKRQAADIAKALNAISGQSGELSRQLSVAFSANDSAGRTGEVDAVANGRAR